MSETIKKIAYDVAVAQFGVQWAEEHVATGQVEPSPDEKKYADHYSYVVDAREAVGAIAEGMNAEGLAGSFRVQLVGAEAVEG